MGRVLDMMELLHVRFPVVLVIVEVVVTKKNFRILVPWILSRLNCTWSRCGCRGGVDTLHYINLRV